MAREALRLFMTATPVVPGSGGAKRRRGGKDRTAGARDSCPLTKIVGGRLQSVLQILMFFIRRGWGSFATRAPLAASSEPEQGERRVVATAVSSHPSTWCRGRTDPRAPTRPWRASSGATEGLWPRPPARHQTATDAPATDRHRRDTARRVGRPDARQREHRSRRSARRSCV
jgi:hypothetical protein